jgi:hypothetical protein
MKFHLLVRKIFLLESFWAFRADVRRYRHFALSYYSEFTDSRQARRDFLVQARLAKRRMLVAKQRLADTEPLFGALSTLFQPVFGMLFLRA